MFPPDAFAKNAIANLQVILLMMAVLCGTAIFASAHQVCPIDNSQCKGCGCKGGPGYRGPNGKCVGFRKLDKVCGIPPIKRCEFENAPGTGANRECALHEHDKK